MIKRLTIKDFEYFENHRSMIEEGTDELFGNSLFLMKGEKWRDMRASLSPAFTGNKMRQMFDLVSVCAEDMVNFLHEESKGVDVLNKEIKDMFMRYTTDVIATSGFGVQTNSLRDKDNEFLRAGRNVIDFSSLKSTVKIFILHAFPRLAKALNLQYIEKSVRDFFIPVVFDTMETRKRNNIFRPDMINMLMEMRQDGAVSRSKDDGIDQDAGFAIVEESHIGRKVVKRKYTDMELLGQSFIFFFAGVESTSNTLLFTIYELAMNVDIQNKLFEEIQTMNVNIDGTRITYDLLHKMKYMDQVISETLRKWPPFGLADRVCVKDYLYDDGNGRKFRIEKGTSVWIPIYGLHHDKQYYPHPDQFNPERFSDEYKKKIVTGSYLPFGMGPRSCIASRFALMEVKAILYYLLLHFSVEVCDQTIIPPRYKKSPVAVTLEHDLFLGFRPRHR